MTLIEAFAAFIEDVSGASLGQDLFLGAAPSSNKVPDSIWWIIASGGQATKRLKTGEIVKSYQFDIYRRDVSGKSVYDDLHDLEETLNCDDCVQLEGYETIGIDAVTFPVDDDLDSDDRKVGLIRTNITIYKQC